MKSLLIYIACFLLVLPYTSKMIYYAYWNINRTYIAVNYCENKDNKTLNCFAQCQLDKVVKSESPKDNLPIMPANQFQFSVYTPISLYELTVYIDKVHTDKTSIPYNKSFNLLELISLPSPPPELA